MKARAATVAASDRVRIGLIGCGGISVADSNAFLAHPETEIVMVCDVDDARIAKTVERLEKIRDKKPDTTKDYRRVVERKDIDVCIVCTPDHWHALPTIAACRRAKTCTWRSRWRRRSPRGADARRGPADEADGADGHALA